MLLKRNYFIQKLDIDLCQRYLGYDKENIAKIMDFIYYISSIKIY